MRADPRNPDRPEDGSAELDALLLEYVDRLNAGEVLDPELIERDHPQLAETLLEQLELFQALGRTTGDHNEQLGTLGDYTLRRQIGRGGMGVVYEAWENSMDRAVALKVLPPGVAADDRTFQRFMQEAKTAGRLSHPNVVPVYFTGMMEQTPFYAMELVEGETLALILARTKDTEPETETPFGAKDEVGYFGNMAKAFADVADGLQHAHSKGVTHRDIKPSNLILDLDGRLRILDFGLARLEGQEPLTLSGDFVGTPLYMSPEQARRKKVHVDHRTDIYSLGATMYEVICGRPPFRGKNHADTLSQIIERDPVNPRKVNPRVPKDLETIVLKCVRKNSGDRYGTAEALGQDLRRFVRGDAIEAREQPRWQRAARHLSRRWKALTMAALVLVSLTSTTLVVVSKYRASQKLREVEFRARLEHAALELSLAEAGVLGSEARPGDDYFGSFALDSLRDIATLWEPPQSRARKELERLAHDFPERAAVLDDPLGASTLPVVAPAVHRWIVGGLDHLREGRELEALEHFVVARDRWPHHPQPALLIAKTYLLLGRPENAERTHESLFECTPVAERDSVVFWIVSQHLLLKEYETARAWSKRILEPGPHHFLLGTTHSALGQDDVAAKHLETACELLPGSAVPPRALAGLLWVQNHGDWSRDTVERIDRLLRRALELDPKDVGARWLRAEVLFRLEGRGIELERFLEESLRLADEDPSMRSLRACHGWIRYLQGDLEAAERFLEEALEANPPNRAMVLTSLGVVLKRRGKYEEALDVLQESTELDSEHAWAWTHSAEILLRLGRAPEAAEAARRAIDRPPKNNARFVLTRALLELGKVEDALSEARRLTAVDNPPPWHLYLLGKALLATGDPAEAKRTLRRAAEHPNADAYLREKIERQLVQAEGTPGG